MKPDRPLIVSILFLAGGLTLIFGYAKGVAGLSAAYPISNSTLHIDVNTTGPAALGGIALLGIGVLFLVWSLLAALVSQAMQLAGSDRGPKTLMSYRTVHREEMDHDADDASVARPSAPVQRASFLGLDSTVPLATSAEVERQEYHPS